MQFVPTRNTYTIFRQTGIGSLVFGPPYNAGNRHVGVRAQTKFRCFSHWPAVALSYPTDSLFRNDAAAVEFEKPCF